MSMMENLKLDLIKELGLDQLDEEKKQKTLEEMGEVIQQRVVMKIIDALDEEKQAEFSKLLEAEEGQVLDEKVLDVFLTENIPNLDQLISEEIAEYKKDLIDFVSAAKSDASTSIEENQSETSVLTKEEEDETK